MGIDGRQYLEIRGPKEMLDRIEACGAALSEGDEMTLMIAKRFFGPAAEKKHREARHLVLSYEFRNQDVYDYLERLLIAYPQCWMRNDYKTEDGTCGLWIARMRGGVPSVQKLAWQELTIEEIVHAEDFSEKIEITAE